MVNCAAVSVSPSVRQAAEWRAGMDVVRAQACQLTRPPHSGGAYPVAAAAAHDAARTESEKSSVFFMVMPCMMGGNWSEGQHNESRFSMLRLLHKQECRDVGVPARGDEYGVATGADLHLAVGYAVVGEDVCVPDIRRKVRPGGK